MIPEPYDIKKDRQAEQQLADLKMMRETYAQHRYHTILAEKIGDTTLRQLYPKKKNWLRRLINKIRS